MSGVRKDPTKPATREIWLTVLRGGGLWKVSEIAAELESGPDDVHKRIAMMARRGYVRRHKKDSGTLHYSIDRTCKIPLGVCINELMAVGMA